MSKKHVMIIAATGIACLVPAMAFTGLGMCQDEEMDAKAVVSATSPVKVNNTICPVTGSKVNMANPVTAEYNGKLYNLCCPLCPATFNADPEKYSRIAEEQAKRSK